MFTSIQKLLNLISDITILAHICILNFKKRNFDAQFAEPNMYHI